MICPVYIFIILRYSNIQEGLFASLLTVSCSFEYEKALKKPSICAVTDSSFPVDVHRGISSVYQRVTVRMSI